MKFPWQSAEVLETAVVPALQPVAQEIPERKSMVLGLNDEISALLQLSSPGAFTPGAALNLYINSTAVSVPVDTIVKLLTAIEPMLKIDGILQRGEMPDVIRFLKKPSPFHTGRLFREALAVDFLVTGEAYLIATGDVSRPPLEAYPISPRNLSPNKDVNGIPTVMTVGDATFPGSYGLRVVDQEARYFRVDTDTPRHELAQMRNHSIRDNGLLRGQSPLLPASREVRHHILGTEHNVSILERGGRLSLSINFEEDIDPDDFKDIQRKIMAEFGGASRAGSMLVTGGGKVNVDEMGMNPKDMDFASLVEFARRALALQYQVPLALVTTEATTFANLEASILLLYDFAVIPLVERLFEWLSDTLLPRFGHDPTITRISFDPDEIPALRKRRNEELELRARVGIETIDELREFVGKAPYEGEGADKIYRPASTAPIDINAENDRGVAPGNLMDLPPRNDPGANSGTSHNGPNGNVPSRTSRTDGRN